MNKYFKSQFEKMQGKAQPQIVVLNSFLNPGSLILSVGALLAVFGAGVIIFPRFFAVLFGLFFIFFGVVFSLLAYKLIKFKNSVEARWKDLSKNSSIIVQQMHSANSDIDKEFSDNITHVLDDKKITWH